MTDLPRPETPGPWRVDSTRRVVAADWVRVLSPYRQEHELAGNGEAVAALPDWVALADQQAERIERVIEYAQKLAADLSAIGSHDEAIEWREAIYLLRGTGENDGR